MLKLKNAELLAFDSGETVILAHNAQEATLARLAQTFFGRSATESQWRLGIDALKQPISIQESLNWFQSHSALQNPNNTDYIQTLYRNALDRAATPDELSHTLQQLDNASLSRNDLALNLANSNEAIATIGSVMVFEGWV